MDFDELAEAQGWTEQTCLQLCREFISMMGLGDQLDAFAQERADQEAPRCGTTDNPHVWRLNKHGRICVVCLKIEEGKGPKEP